MTPAQSLDARAAAPTPSGGVQIAPRPRRADYLLTAAVGLVLPPLIMAPLGIASYFVAHHRLPWALLLIVLALAVCSMAQGFFAVRSSLGGLVAGLVALAVHAVVLCAPQGAQSSPMPWARAFIPTGALLIAAGVLLGGSWGMRRARRAGRADARLAMRLAAADRAMGVTPPAPPSRRRDHVMSFVVTATAFLVALGTFFAGRSTLGARATGPLLMLAGLPALLRGAWPTTPGAAQLMQWLPNDPTGMGLITTGLLLTTTGWGVHLARRRGRAGELVGLKSAESATPAGGIARV